MDRTRTSVLRLFGMGALTLLLSCGGGDGSTGPSPATAVSITTQPSATAQNTVVLGQQPVVQLRDADGGAVSQGGVAVTAGIASGGGSLGGTTSVLTNANGQAIFTNLKIIGTVGGRTLQFTSTGLTAAISGTVTLSAGPAAQLAVTTQPSTSVQNTLALTQQPVVQVRDVSGNAVPQSGVSVTASIGSGGGTLNGTATVLTNGSGQAVFTGLSILGTVGTRTLDFGALGLVIASSGTIDLTAGPATRLTLTTQPSAAAQSGVPFALQPAVQLRDTSANAVAQSNVSVTASIASGGGSLGGTVTVLTDGSGQAAFTDLALTGAPGSRTLQFAATSLTAVTSGTIALSGAPATTLTLTTAPSTTAQNTVAFAQQPVVQLRDSLGNAVNQSGVLITAGIASGGGSVGGNPGATTNANGQAVFTDLSIFGTVGAHTIRFTGPGLDTLVSGTITLSAGPTHAIQLTTQPSATAQNTVVFAQQPAVQLVDFSGNTVSQASVSITALTATGGGVVVGTSTVVTNGSGQASFTDLAIVGAAGAHTIQFDGPAGVANGLSGTITLSAGPATQLALTTQPSATAQSGSTLAQQPVVQLRDTSGNAVAQGSVSVSASIASGGGTLGGTTTVATNGSGQASFTDLVIAGTAGARTLQFTATSLATATSGTITISAGSATQITITTQPSATAQNTAALAQQPVVQLRDSVGNAVNQAGVSITASIATGGGALSGTAVVATNASGQASFTNLAILGTIGARTLHFSGAGLDTATSGTITLSAGPATQVALTTQPSATAQNNVALAQQPVAQLRDTSGNAVSQASVSISAGMASGGGALGGTTSVATNGSGQASFTDLKLVGTVGAHTLQFTGAGLATATSGTITLSAGVATQIALTTQPSATAQNNVAFAQQPVAQLRDTSGNAVSQASVSIAAAIASGGGALGGTASVATNAGGQASFTNLKLIGTVGARTLQFTGTSLATATSGTITLSAGPATQLALTTQPADTARSGVALARQPAIQLRDTSGNDVSQSSVNVTASVASGSGTLGGTVTLGTNAGGLVTFTNLALTGTGAHTLQFAASGKASATSTSIALPLTLTDGVAVSALAGAGGSARWYVIPVAGGLDSLVVTTTGGTGNADLYVRNGQLPSLVTSTCSGTTGTNAEQCKITSPSAGSWYVLVYGTATYSSASLTATTYAGSGCTLGSLPDTDGDRLPDCAETNTHVYVDSLHTGTDPNVADTDGDGIKDGDEVLGTLAGLDLPAMGVSPLHRDILMEYDWFDDNLDPGTCGAHSHRPTATAVGMVATAMGGANVPNPDGTTGVNFISDYGQGGVFTGGNLISDADGVLSFGVNNPEFVALKNANMAANRVGYFHYVILPHRYSTNSTSSGQAELPGNDLIVSLYCFGSNGNVANTIMHELGHNLSLRHGGDVDINYKPNYNSVMNYLFQFSGIDTNCSGAGDGVLSYSVGTRPSLDENNLDETKGICGSAPGADWNGDADAVDVGISADININPNTGVGDTVHTVLTDYSDWSHLIFTGLGDADGAALVAPQVISCPAIPEKYRRAP